MTSDATTKKSDWCLNTMQEIKERWDDETDLELVISKKWEHEIQSWFQWFETTYPDADMNKPLQLLRESKERIDFRLLLIAFPIEAFILMRVLAACYSVDKAICGFSSSSSTRLQNLQSMNQLEYLSSEELIAWWEVSLCELDDLIKSQDSVSMSDTFLVADIMAANQTLQEMEDKLIEDCWPTMIEQWEVWRDIPGGIGEIQRQIEKRTERLRLAADSLTTTFENAKKRTGSETPMKNTEAHAAESRSREAVAEGIRRRIPFIDSNDITPEQSLNRSSGLDTVSFTPLLNFDLRHEADLTTTIAEQLSGMTVFQEKIFAIYRASKRILRLNSVVAFTVHKSTALVVFFTFILSAGVTAVLSTKATTQDSGFFTALSQGFFTILSIYLAALPPLRTKMLELRYSFWFWFTLFVCGMTSLLSLVFYYRYPVISTFLSCVSGLTQALCTLLLVECVEKAVKAGNIGGVEPRPAVRNDHGD